MNAEAPFEQEGLLRLLKRWRLHLALIALVGGLLSFGATFFITPTYKSVGVLYPSNIAPYSEESISEQFMQMLKSGQVEDSVLACFQWEKRFRLSAHAQKKSRLHMLYEERILVERSEYEAVVVSALDEDPAMARRLVEFVIAQTDRLIGTLQRQKLKEVRDMHALSLDQIKVQVDSVDSALNRYRRTFGILDYESQVKEITRQYYKNLGSTSVAQRELRQALDNLTRHGAVVQFLSARAKALGKTYGFQEAEYLKSVRDYERSFSYTNILTQPQLSDKRAYPVRWVFALAGFAAALFFGILLVAFLDRVRKDQGNG